MSQSNPFPLHLPKDRGIAQMSDTIDRLIQNVAWELGNRYDAAVSPVNGHDWLLKLEALRQDSFVLHDPTFVFGEPEYHSDSPVWLALPPWSPELRGQFYRVRRTRNQWTHHVMDQDWGRFVQGVQRIAQLILTLDLDSKKDLFPLNERIAELKNNPNFREETAEEKGAALIKLLEERDRQAEAMERENKKLIIKLEQEGAGNQELRKKFDLLQAEIAKAREERQALLEQLHEWKRKARLNTSEPSDDLQPGEPWRGPLGVRVLSLKRDLRDLYDPQKQILLSDELGPVVTDACGRWLTIMPAGGPVHLTPGGHAAAQSGIGYVYLGRLDEVPDDSADAELLLEDSDEDDEYEVLKSDVVEVATGVRLSDLHGEESAARVAASLAEAQDDGTFRRTRDGALAAQTASGWRRTDKPDEWF